MVRDRWSIWWLDGRNPGRLDPPVVGGFKDGIGTFIADDTFDGRPILVRFLWSDITDHDVPLGAGVLDRRRRDLGGQLGDGVDARRLGSGRRARYRGGRGRGARDRRLRAPRRRERGASEGPNVQPAPALLLEEHAWPTKTTRPRMLAKAIHSHRCRAVTMSIWSHDSRPRAALIYSTGPSTSS